MPDRWVITFESVYFVMKAERILKERGIKIDLIPTPREISSDCGIAIELTGENLDRVREILKKDGMAPASFREWKSK
jgi:hypothetical protein